MKYWIFQGRPESYKFNPSVKNDLLNVWNVKAHKKEIKKGDKAIIWMTGEKGGCYALVDILSDPSVLGKSEDYDLWDSDDETGRMHQNEDETAYKVGIKFIHNLFDRPILRHNVPTTEGMLEKLKSGIRGTNFTSSKEEFELMVSLIESD